MPNIKIIVSNKRAAAEGAPVIVCGNSDYVLQFTFDEEWSAAAYKTARFVYVQNGQVLHEDRDFNGTEVQVPALANTSQVKVGVFAGTLYTSTPAVIPCKASILCGSGEPANPTPEEDARIMELLNLAIKQQADAEAAADDASASAAAAAASAQEAEGAKNYVNAIVAGNEAYTKYESDTRHAPVIVQTAAGSRILVQDSAGRPALGLRVLGHITQDGEPAPEAPLDVKAVGESGYFDGELLQGVYGNATGIHSSNTFYVCSKNPIPCKEGDNIALMYEVVASAMSIVYYDKDMKQVNYIAKANASELAPTAPANASYFNFSINENGLSLTPQTAKHICVTINGMYALIQKHVNKNLWEFGDVSGTATVPYTLAKPIPAGTYTMSALVTSADTDIATSRFMMYDKNAVEIKSLYFNRGARDSQSFTVSSDIYMLRFYASRNNETSTGDTFTFADIQLELGDTMTDFAEHEEQTTYIPIAEPLRGIGEVKDEIACVDGVYGVIRRIGKYVCDGSSDENWTDTGSTAYPNTYLYSGLNGLIRAKKNIYDCMSDYFTYIKEDVDIPHIRMANVNSYPYIAVWVSRNMFASISEFKTWLTENNVTVHYLLAEETFTPFADQTPFQELQTFKPVTYITASDDAEMEVEYVADTKIYIDNKIAEICAAMLNS